MKYLVKLAWWVIRRFDRRRYEMYSHAVRNELAEAVERISPTETPIFSHIEPKDSSPVETQLFSLFERTEAEQNEYHSRYAHPNAYNVYRNGNGNSVVPIWPSSLTSLRKGGTEAPPD